MIGFTIKVFTAPLIIIAADYLTSSITFNALWQPAAIGIFLAFASHLMEAIFLGRNTLWISNIIDFLFSTLTLYASQFLLPDATITMIGALFTAAMLAAFEHLTHLFLIHSGRIS